FRNYAEHSVAEECTNIFVLKFGKGFGFALKSACGLFIGKKPWIKDFQCNNAIEKLILGFEYQSHPTAAFDREQKKLFFDGFSDKMGKIHVLSREIYPYPLVLTQFILIITRSRGDRGAPGLDQKKRATFLTSP